MSAAPGGTATLHYWKGRGRANPIRFMLEETATPYKERFIQGKEDLEGLRGEGKLMFNQLPLLEIDGLNLVQSDACIRYLARKHDMLGKDAAEGAVVDMVQAATLELRGVVLGYVFVPEADRASKLAESFKTTVPKFLAPIDKLLSQSKTGFVAGGDVTMADVTLYEAISFLLDAPTPSKDWFDSYPSAQKHHTMMQSRKQMAAYIKSDRRHPFPDDVYKKAVVDTLYS
eukprot:CAMPEP_0173393488 /NCGR_PEP_ID=MMETSP1356-20130122/22136_1 /TAXON_ID=77927 ORGANISM="Hemiselmis virescens, Strain PCC157" /NCGR_SAMPLE_ID=MMETSP1356 /ASSEMBLY_ACC=CAM_ASM_000847 /LENGTH=228 /DNA_ID=CAMNT_0014351509 /DNA_START=118 /DNA_END=807 /DNA_ORIENTATION=+